MNSADRINYIIETLCDGTAQVFSDKTSIGKSQVSLLRSGKLGPDIGPYAERIARAFPELNCRWLLTGEGNPIGESGNAIVGLLKELREIEHKVDRIVKEKSRITAGLRDKE